MSRSIFRKPLFWLIIGSSAVILGTLMIASSIVVKTAVLPSVRRGIEQMRYIDSVEDPDGCEAFLVGDIGCSGKRLQALKTPSHEKANVCLSSDSPPTRALAAISKWCSAGEPGCEDKQVACKQGEKYLYHFFSVLNPLEVLNGEKALLQEMEPVRITRTSDKVDVDTSKLESAGTISYKEAAMYTLTDAADDHLLDQVVVMPNLGPFTTLSDGVGNRAPVDAVANVIAAGVFYTKFQEKVDNMTSSVPIREWFRDNTAVNLDRLVIDQFRSGRFILALGELLASPACRLLVPILAAGLSDSFPPALAIDFMCTDRFRNNIGFSVLNTLLASTRVKISPEDGPFFYEFEKGCADRSDTRSNTCYLNDMCPYPVGSPEYNACIEPSLTEEYVDSLFSDFAEWDTAVSNKDQTTALVGARSFLLKGCMTSRGQVPSSPAVCELLMEQLQRIGRAGSTVNNPKWKDIVAAHGWENDSDTAEKLYPYFVNGTIRELMGFGSPKPKKDPNGSSVGPQLWVDSLYANGTTSPYTLGPYEVAVSSRAAPAVGSRFEEVTSNSGSSSGTKLKHSCAFDSGCMLSSKFQSRSMCEAEPGVCAPEFVEGQGVGFTEAKLFGQRSIRHSYTVFEPETFVKANFSLANSDETWGPLIVDHWRVSSINFKVHNCAETHPRASRGVDCDSPKGTQNIGFHQSYKVPFSSPRDLHVPLYISFPWFKPQVDVIDGVYDPLSKLEIRPCASCPVNRDWTSKLLTEPETGTHVFGTSKMQVNARLSSHSAKASRLHGTVGHDLRVPRTLIPGEFDLVIPLFWMDRHDSAAPYQALKLAALQALPRTINTIFSVLISFGLVLLLAGIFMLRRGVHLKAKYRKLITRRDSIKEPTQGSDTGRATSAGASVQDV
jgi:hypothetical protein